MATFTAQIGYLIGDTTAYTSDITQALNDGVVDVVTRSIAVDPTLAPLFATSETVVDGSGLTLSDGFPIIFATRGGIKCLPGSSALETQYGTATSIHYAVDDSPVIYTKLGKAYVRPIPVAGAQAIIHRVNAGAVDDLTPAIANFPSDRYRLVVLFAAYRVGLAKLSDAREDFPTDLDAETAFDAIADLTSTTGIAIDYSTALTEITKATVGLRAYIEGSEDLELAQGKALEVTKMLEILRGEVLDAIQLAGLSVADYGANVSKSIQLYAAKLQKHTAEISQLAGSIQMCLSEYQAAFDTGGGR